MLRLRRRVLLLLMLLLLLLLELLLRLLLLLLALLLLLLLLGPWYRWHCHPLVLGLRCRSSASRRHIEVVAHSRLTHCDYAKPRVSGGLLLHSWGRFHPGEEGGGGGGGGHLCDEGEHGWRWSMRGIPVPGERLTCSRFCCILGKTIDKRQGTRLFTTRAHVRCLHTYSM